MTTPKKYVAMARDHQAERKRLGACINIQINGRLRTYDCSAAFAPMAGLLTDKGEFHADRLRGIVGYMEFDGLFGVRLACLDPLIYKVDLETVEGKYFVELCRYAEEGGALSRLYELCQ
jgi:hypothetical protein